MLKRILRYFALVITISLLLPGCGKYEDGPDLTFASKKTRITNTWIVNEVFEDGVRIFELPPEYYNFVFKIEQNGSAQIQYVNTMGQMINGEWEFYDDKCNFRFIVMALNGPAITSEFKILRLKLAQLWVIDLDTGQEIRFIRNSRF